MPFWENAISHTLSEPQKCITELPVGLPFEVLCSHTVGVQLVLNEKVESAQKSGAPIWTSKIVRVSFKDTHKTGSQCRETAIDHGSLGP